MCCVMPPASPPDHVGLADGVEQRGLAVVDVAHDGDDRRTRHRASRRSSGVSNRPSSTSDSATRLTVWPNSSAMSWAVSASITSVILTIWPCFIRKRITSTARSAMRLASSWMVIVSGMVTSRAIFSFGSFGWWPFRRCTRRRNAATERMRSSSSPRRRGHRQAAAVLLLGRGAVRSGLGGMMTLVGMPGRRMTTRLLVFLLPPRARAADGVEQAARDGAPGVGSSAVVRATGAARPAVSPRRRLASSSALRLALRRRGGDAALPRACALRRPRARPSRAPRARRRALASISAWRRSSSSRRRASTSAMARASRSSSVSVRSTMPPPRWPCRSRASERGRRGTDGRTRRGRIAGGWRRRSGTGCGRGRRRAAAGAGAAATGAAGGVAGRRWGGRGSERPQRQALQAPASEQARAQPRQAPPALGREPRPAERQALGRPAQQHARRRACRPGR